MTKHLNWYKRSPRDWQHGTIGMSLELRGFYSAILDAMWERQGQLPKDEKWLAVACQCSTRMVRSLIIKLVEQGKVIETSTGYYNRRMMADILGLDDVQPQGQFAPVSRPVRAPVKRESSASRARVEREPQTKNRKNPEFSTRDLEAESEAEKETESITARPVVEAARDAGRPSADWSECKSAFNGSTAAMLAEVGSGMGLEPNAPEVSTWLANLLRTNGQDAVAQSYQMLLTARAERKPIIRVLPWWAKTASTLKAQSSPVGDGRIVGKDGSYVSTAERTKRIFEKAMAMGGSAS